MVRLDHAVAPLGGVTEGAVPQALKFVVNVNTTFPDAVLPETVDL